MPTSGWRHDKSVHLVRSLCRLFKNTLLAENTELHVGDIVYRGRAKPVNLTRYVNADDIIALIDERVFDGIGNVLSTASRQELDELLRSWFSTNFTWPCNMVEYQLTDTDMAAKSGQLDGAG